MGTRNLTAVQLDGEYKIAQYGQWDGYPSGQGTTVFHFLEKLNPTRMKKFKARLRKLKWADDEYLSDIQARADAGEFGDAGWSKHYPELSRDTAAEILEMVYTRPPGMRLVNEIDFALDSLFCEWAYVIDLDAGVLEVYKGFNQKPVPKNARFKGAGKSCLNDEASPKYTPIRKKATFKLDALPDLAGFLKKCGKE